MGLAEEEVTEIFAGPGGSLGMAYEPSSEIGEEKFPPSFSGKGVGGSGSSHGPSTSGNR